MRARRLAAVVAVGVVLAACGRTPLGGPEGEIDHPTDPGALVLRVENVGGFIPEVDAFSEVPAFSLYGDGRVVVPGVRPEIYPAPALVPPVEFRLTAAGIQAVLRDARAAGLQDGDRDLRTAGVVDAGRTVFTVNADGSRTVVSVEALGVEVRPRGASAEEIRLRAALTRFRDRLFDLRRRLPEGSVGEERPYEVSAVHVKVTPPEPGDPSVERQVKAWPLGTPLSSFGREVRQGVRCGSVEGADLAKLLPELRDANRLTIWESGGARHQIAVRPALPDDSGCPA